MEHLLLEYFKDKPAILNSYYKYKAVIINLALLCMLCMAIIARTEAMKSLAFGIAAGIVLINLGQSITHIRSKDSSNKSVNG
jgi:hypothetical protein